MLLQNTHIRAHLPWIIATTIVLAISIAWFALASLGQSAWPSGSSLPGFTFGVVGGLICLFEFLIWPRKKLRRWRLGKLTLWMRAHIWLGLLAVPILILHTGFRWGGPLSSTLMVLFLLVVASGIWGLVLQQFLPAILLREVPAETIYSQIDSVAQLLAREANHLVATACGQQVSGQADSDGTADDSEFVVGAIRSSGAIKGLVPVTPSLQELLVNFGPLWEFHNNQILKYLLHGESSGSDLVDANKSKALFSSLRLKLELRAHVVIDTLEDLCTQRRQLCLQARIHFWLHNWLWVHLPLSVSLIVLMFVHVFVALKYW